MRAAAFVARVVAFVALAVFFVALLAVLMVFLVPLIFSPAFLNVSATFLPPFLVVFAPFLAPSLSIGLSGDFNCFGFTSNFSAFRRLRHLYIFLTVSLTPHFPILLAPLTVPLIIALSLTSTS